MTQNPEMANQQSAPKANAPAPILAGFDWTQVKWAAAACRVPALVGCLLLATPFHDPAAGVVAAGASLSVGLATTGLPEKIITGHRLILTALGSGLALGSRFLGHETVLRIFGNKLKNR
jgi:hypothetical protein